MTPRCRAPFETDAELACLAAAFLDHSLPAPMWTNDAHWAVAIHLLRHRPDLDLPRDLPGLISRFNEAKGNRNTETAGYHETITQAAIYMAELVIEASPGRTACQQVNRLMASPTGKSDWLFRFWSKDALMTPLARRLWVPPDIAPLPRAWSD